MNKTMTGNTLPDSLISIFPAWAFCHMCFSSIAIAGQFSPVLKKPYAGLQNASGLPDVTIAVWQQTFHTEWTLCCPTRCNKTKSQGAATFSLSPTGFFFLAATC